jgi:hypothetical protein
LFDVPKKENPNLPMAQKRKPSKKKPAAKTSAVEKASQTEDPTG